MDKLEIGEVFTIIDENDEELEVEVIGSATIGNDSYAAVSFIEDLQAGTEGDIDLFFLKVDQEGDFAAIESDEEFEKVSAAFDEMLKREN
ncbi:DUF1292 domain-containing protein [Bacillus sp. REN3]|uniref:DUF1292 domain-containing protein n=1 Tax=Bacillus sp. REN3 TaxID=2802440 RepID=UPI001AEEC5B5|nr:DUF1292 domain-containing protein [Bacillus sp. REN3]